MKSLIHKLVICFIFLCITSCEDNTIEQKNKKQVNKKEIEHYHLRYKNEEKYRIEQYIKRSGLKMEQTGSGLYYKVYKKNTEGVTIEENNKVVFNYVMFDLRGDTLYKDLSNKHFIITNGTDAESGIHEGLMKMKEGESAILIMTSQLGHGLMGDNRNIPPQTTLKVDVEVLEVEKPTYE